jgi:hypothetical protein
MTASRRRPEPRAALDERVQPVQLAIDPDAQRLKRARRRIDPR